MSSSSSSASTAVPAAASGTAPNSSSSWSALVKRSAISKKLVANATQTTAAARETKKKPTSATAATAAEALNAQTIVQQPTLPSSFLQHHSALLRTPKDLLRLISLYVGLFSLAPLFRTCKQAGYDLKWMRPRLTLMEEMHDEEEDNDNIIPIFPKKQPRELRTFQQNLSFPIIPFPVLCRSGLLRHITHLSLNCSFTAFDAIESGKLHLLVGGGDSFSSPVPSLLSLEIGIHGFIGWMFPSSLHILEIQVFPRSDKIHENYHLTPRMNGGKELYDSFVPLKELRKLSLRWHLELDPKRVDSNGEKDTWSKLISSLPSLLPLLKCTKLHTLKLDDSYTGPTVKGGDRMRMPDSTLKTLRCHPSLTSLDMCESSYEWLQALTKHPHLPHETSIRNMKVLHFRPPLFEHKYTHIYRNLFSSLTEISKGVDFWMVDDLSFFKEMKKMRKVDLRVSRLRVFGENGLGRWLQECGKEGGQKDHDFQEMKESDIQPEQDEEGGITHFSLQVYTPTTPWPSIYIRLLLSLKNLRVLYLGPIFLSMNDMIYVLITGLPRLEKCSLTNFKSISDEVIMTNEHERECAKERQEKMNELLLYPGGYDGIYCNTSLTSLKLDSIFYSDRLSKLFEILPSLRELDVFTPSVSNYCAEPSFECFTKGCVTRTLEKLTVRNATPTSQYMRLYALQNLRELTLVAPLHLPKHEELREMKEYFRTDLARKEMRYLRNVEILKGTIVYDLV